MKMIMRLGQRKRKDGSPGNFFVEFPGGRRRTLGTKNAEKARRLYRKVEREYLQNKVADITGVCRTTLGEFRDEYVKLKDGVHSPSTFRANKLALKKLVRYCGKKVKLDQLSPRHISIMVKEEQRKGNKIRSINNYIRHARAVMNTAIEWGYVRINPLRHAKELSAQKTRPEYIPKSRIPGYIKSIEDIDLRRLVVSYLATGRRRSELAFLRWDKIDLGLGTYAVITKGGKERTYYINSLFRSVLTAIGQKKEGRVFDRWKHPDTITRLVKKTLIKAGLPNVTLHGLRHSFASMKAEEGRTLKEIQELLGHTDQRTTEIYAHLTNEHLASISEVNLGPIDLFDAQK